MARRQTSRLGRIGAVTLVAAFLCGSIGSGLDRIGTKSAGAMSAVPKLFADASLGSAALRHIANEQYAEAEATASAAVRRSPLEPARSGALGTARLALGKRGPADQAFRVSGGLGWHDPLTQLYWLQVALDRGEYDIAAERLDALMRDNPAEARRPELFAGLSATAAGQRALASRLKAAPSWRDAYFLPAAETPVSELRARAAVLRQLDDKPVLGCKAGAPLADRMVRSGEPALGASIWREQCPEADDGLLFDPGLSRAGVRRLSPFAWVKYGDGVSDSHNGGVTLDTAVSFTRRFASQLIVLEPGNYTLAWSAADESGEPSDRIVAAFGCTADTPVQLTSERRAGTKYQAEISVTAACSSQYLALSLRPGNGAVKLTELTLAAGS
ncbi:hypothetical protein [Altererythrobacter sp. ZODW24]|uniref:hypothetical protein n=1 Tax=Altererythrobacter sp. ZODW24 TaxID=2185142 RepID=UPI000DF7D599|nr:hypothetical protein [Altererythrobacter sp. ZODW24]